MRAIRIAVVAFLVLIVCGVLGLWWAGFAPFPTEPVLLAGYNREILAASKRTTGRSVIQMTYREAHEDS